MKLIIAGSRHMPFGDYQLIGPAVKLLENLLDCKVTEVVSGLARGADTYGMKWAVCVANLPVKKFPADWETYGKGAGPIRNAQMRDYADALLAFQWDNSRGTANMVEQMVDAVKPALVVHNGNLDNASFYGGVIFQ